MIYDPENPQPFREILRRIRDVYHLSALKMLELTYGRGPTGFRIAPSSLNRFINGQSGETRVAALRAIETALAAHRDYRHLFEPTTTPDAVSAPTNGAFESFVLGMTRLFLEKGKNGPDHPLDGEDKLGERLIGWYAIYRPSWISFRSTGRYNKETIISVVHIEKSDFGYTITDTQRFPYGSGIFSQTDRGCLVAAGRFLYFLTKEQEGTTVRLGIFSNPIYIAELAPVDSFEGIWFSSSHLAIYPPLKFFGRRINGPDAVKSTRVNLDEIDDEDARNYLQNPDPEFFRTNMP